MSTLPVTRLTEQEYLAIERAAEQKSEFVDGETFAMAGGSPRHARLASKVLAKLDAQLEGRDCVALNSDLRIRTPLGDQFYPDVSVVCGAVQTHGGDNDACVNPVVIVEVFSPSTAKYDRGLKFVLYREIPSIQDYLIFHFDKVHVEHYSRQMDGSWLFQQYRGDDARVTVTSIGCELVLESVYAGAMEWPA